MEIGFIQEDSRVPPSLGTVVTYRDLPRRCILKSPFTEKTVISYGVIAVTRETFPRDFKYLLVRRKFSPSFILILRGSYREAALLVLIQGLTQSEVDLLRKLVEDPRKIAGTYGTIFPDAAEGDLSYATKRIEQSQSYLRELLRGLKSHRSEPEWLWPKGRPLSRYEDRLVCAQREFSEETGLDNLSGAQLVSMEPLVESSVGLGGKVYETRCWVYLFESCVILPNISESQSEIGDSRWVGEEEARELLKEAPGKLRVLEEAKKLVEEYGEKK